MDAKLTRDGDTFRIVDRSNCRDENMLKKTSILAAVLFSTLLPVQKAEAQADPFIGQIIWVPYNFCPNGWAETNGRLLQISQNMGLFSLLGTTFGGDGRTTFALPDLRARVPVGEGQGRGLSNRVLGETGGNEAITLTSQNLPAHSHPLIAREGPPAGTGTSIAGNAPIYRAEGKDVVLGSTGSTGASVPVDNAQPYLTLKACIAISGIFPPRG